MDKQSLYEKFPQPNTQDRAKLILEELMGEMELPPKTKDIILRLVDSHAISLLQCLKELDNDLKGPMVAGAAGFAISRLVELVTFWTLASCPRDKVIDKLVTVVLEVGCEQGILRGKESVNKDFPLEDR